METERLLRIREAIVHFYRLHDQYPTPENYRAWFNSLSTSQRTQIQDLGFENGRKLISYQSCLLEQKGFYIKEFLKMHLSPEDFDYLLLLVSPVPEGEAFAC